MASWIKIYREIQEHHIWNSDEPFDKRSAWIDLLLMANYKDFKAEHRGRVVERKRGEINTSVVYLAKRWGWSRNKVYRFLRLLQDEKMIALDGTPDGTLVTVENYEKYQGGRTANGTPHGTPDGTPHGTHDKNIKNIKNNNISISLRSIDIYRDLPDELVDALTAFEEMRKSIKKPIKTDRARKMLLNRLDRLAGDDTDLKVRLLDEATFNNWQSVYPLKETDDGTENDFGRSKSQRGRMANGTVRSGSDTREDGFKYPGTSYGFQTQDQCETEP